MENYKLFWGDSHTNLRHRHMPYLPTALACAKDMLDFWPIAYYPHGQREIRGFRFEDWLDKQVVDDDWKTVCEFAGRNNQTGDLVIFPGYEWHGDATWGDHNVIYLRDDPPLLWAETLKDLYAELRRQKLQAMVVPHHTAYMPGIRSKNWDVHDEQLSPLAEVYSKHGSCEADEEWVPMRSNWNMGPGMAGGTVEEGLNRGYKLGLIASTDNHSGFPGVHGFGLMGCYAKELSRESLWEAFSARRVYAVSADRIELDFRLEDQPMGSVIRKEGVVTVRTHVRGSDAIDRIELLRNNRLIGCYGHSGQWDIPSGSGLIRCKLRLEAGWGPRWPENPQKLARKWECSLALAAGRIASLEKCWTSPRQYIRRPGPRLCEFGFHTGRLPGIDHLDSGQSCWHPGRNSEPPTEATIFELEGRINDLVSLIIEGKKLSLTLGQLMEGSQVIFFPEEVREYLDQTFHIRAETLPRSDPLYYFSHKAKLHRAVPEQGYTADWSFTDQDPPPGTNSYRLRVQQRNRSMAWSSPIWVENPGIGT